jgi:hypothetical protein
MGAGDPLLLLYYFESQDQNLAVASGGDRVQGLQNERNQQLVQEKQDIAKQDAAAKSHNFWSDLGNIFTDIAKVAGIIASVAVTVCTAGAAGPVAALAIAGIILSSASFVDGEFHVLQKLGVDPKTTGWIDTGLAASGALCSFGAGAASAGGQAASQLAQRVTSAVSGLATMGQGACTIEDGSATSAADRAAADEAQAEVRSSSALRFMQVIVADAAAADDSSKQIMSTIVETKNIEEQTSVQSATAVKG